MNSDKKLELIARLATIEQDAEMIEALQAALDDLREPLVYPATGNRYIPYEELIDGFVSYLLTRRI